LEQYQNTRRVELLDSDAIQTAFDQDADDVIIQSFTPSLRKSFHLRWLCGSPAWPVLGMTHDLSSNEVYDEL